MEKLEFDWNFIINTIVGVVAARYALFYLKKFTGDDKSAIVPFAARDIASGVDKLKMLADVMQNLQPAAKNVPKTQEQVSVQNRVGE